MAQRQRQRQRVDQELRTSQALAVVQNVMEVGIAGVCHYRSLFPGAFFEPAALPDGAGTVPQFCREAIRPGAPSTQTTSGSGVSASRLSSSQPCSMSPITSSILETQTSPQCSRADSPSRRFHETATSTDVTKSYPTAGSCASDGGGEVAAAVDEYEQLKAEARLLLQWLREGVGTAMKDGVLTRVVFGICSTSASSSPSSASYRTDQDRGGCDDGRGSRREHSSKRRRTEGRSTDHLIESYAFDIIHGSNTRRQRRGRGGNRAQVQNAAQALFRNLNGLTSALPPLLHVSCTAASIGGGDDLSAVAAGPFSQTSQFGGTSPLIPPSSRYLTLRVEFSPTAAAAGASPAALYLPNFYGVERAAARPDEGHATIGWGGLGGLSPTTVGRVGDESGVALKVDAFGPGDGGFDVPSAERGGVDASPPTKANTTSSAAKSQRGGGIDSSPSDSADAACPIRSENENESQTSQCTNTDAMGFSEKSPQGWSIDSSAADCDGDRGKGNSIGSQTEDEPHDGQRTNAEAKELAEELPHKCNMDMSVSAPDSDGGIGEHPIRSAATEDAPHESRGTPTETTLSPQKPTRGYGISSSGCGDDGDKGEEKPIRSDTEDEDEDEGELRQRRSQGTPVETTHSPRKPTQGCSIDSTASCSGPEEEEERPVRSEAGCDEYESRPSITARSPVAGEGDESSMAILPPDAKAFAVPYGSNRRKDRGLHIPCTVLESKLEENGDVKYKVIFSCKHLRRKRMLKQWIPSERILSMEELLRTIESSMSREGHRTRLDSVSTAGPMLVSRSFVEDQVKKMGVQSKFVAAACGVLGYTVGSIEESRQDDSDSGTSSELPVGGMKRCTDDSSSRARNADSDETEARPSNGRILCSYIANPIQVFF